MPAPVNRQPTPPPSPPKHVEVTASKSRSGEVLLTRQKSSSEPQINTEELKHPANVEVELSITKNMENYESLKVGVKISSPCTNDDQTKLATADHNLALAMQVLEKEAAQLSTEWF